MFCTSVYRKKERKREREKERDCVGGCFKGADVFTYINTNNYFVSLSTEIAVLVGLFE